MVRISKYAFQVVEGTTPAPTIQTTAYTNQMRLDDATYPPAGSTFKQGEQIPITLKVTNTGTCAWDGKHRLVSTIGNTLIFTSAPPFAAPNAQAEIGLRVTAPNQAGAYRGEWRFADADGKPFGDSFGYSFLVRDTVRCNRNRRKRKRDRRKTDRRCPYRGSLPERLLPPCPQQILCLLRPHSQLLKQQFSKPQSSQIEHNLRVNLPLKQPR